MLFKSKHWLGAQSIGERLCTHTAAKLHDLQGLIGWINGRLTEWDALNRRFEVVRAAKACLLAVFFGWTLLASQIFGLGIVGEHSVIF